jgi:alanine-glyoxylate transaminase/serine-glyoxylate transaminase/serine-pyruvate transaminase
VRRALLDEFNIEIGGGLGALKGKTWRIGLMGESSTEANVLQLLTALERLLPRYGHRASSGAAVAAASAAYGQS